MSAVEGNDELSDGRSSRQETVVEVGPAAAVSTAVPNSSDGKRALEKGPGFRLRGGLEWAKQEWRLICQLALLILMIVVVWGLLSLPITFYYTTTEEVCYYTEYECVRASTV